MYMTRIFTIIAAATYATTASAACWHPSVKGDKDLAVRSLDLICTGLVGQDTGTYQGSETRTQCIADTTAGVKWDYTITNQQKSTNPTNHKVCKDSLQREIDRCGAGGHSSYFNFNFNVAASSGTCQAGTSGVDAK
ncbi:MAG: hypothetical protein M1812_003230 [Candelaria pacifica]|nr:MAG: hypothetical protein M1812_003230 [Candelaria pacifica]